MSGFRPRFFIDALAQEASAGAARLEGAEMPRRRAGARPEGAVARLKDAGAPRRPADASYEGVEVTLGPRDSHHAQRVLRLQTGDLCEVVVGTSAYAAHVTSAKQPVRVMLDERLEGAEAGAAYRARVGLVQALTRPALMDQLLEKGTEVGTSFFVLVPAAGSTRLPEASRVSRLDRWRRVVVEAAKQSKQSVVPDVALAGSLEEAHERLLAEAACSVALEPTASASLREVVERLSEPGGIALWSGPESGWTDKELEWFAAKGVQTARLGQAVLRAETAGPVAVAVTRLVTGDW